MKLKLYFFIFLLVFFLTPITKSQILSQFTWDSNPVTTAAVGPNATSVGANASSSPGGVGGTNGLNPGIPTIDINMNIPNTGGVFDINDIDISVDYRRNESVATMYRRGVFMSNNGAANFRITYRVFNGSVITTVTATNVNIPQDNVYRNYRFTYDNCAGRGTMYVNNVAVWVSPTLTPGQNLYWVGDGNLILGQDMDGAGNNIPNMDNFIMQRYACVVLPIELISFTGYTYGSKNILKWSTATESNNDYFTIEQSNDGKNWQDLKRVYGSGTSHTIREYSTSINDPEKMLNYYRLKQTDFNGQTKNFTVIFVDNSENGEVKVLRTLDLLGREVSESYQGVKVIYYSNGSVIKTISE